MNNSLFSVGKFINKFNLYLPFRLEEQLIYRSKGLEKHIFKRHPNCLEYLKDLEEIILDPDYIGVNPNEKNISFELVKIFSDGIQIGIKLDMKEKYLYVATMHEITLSKIEYRIKNGRLKRFDKE